MHTWHTGVYSWSSTANMDNRHTSDQHQVWVAKLSEQQPIFAPNKTLTSTVKASTCVCWAQAAQWKRDSSLVGPKASENHLQNVVSKPVLTWLTEHSHLDLLRIFLQSNPKIQWMHAWAMPQIRQPLRLHLQLFPQLSPAIWEFLMDSRGCPCPADQVPPPHSWSQHHHSTVHGTTCSTYSTDRSTPTHFHHHLSREK